MNPARSTDQDGTTATRLASVRRSLPHAGVFSVILLALALGACSLSFPMASLTSDDSATGSIAHSTMMLSPTLDEEDWRRAKAALSVALDPQGNGADVTWANPRSGARGAFVATAEPFVKDDKVCRSFKATLAAPPKPERRLKGSACRSRDGDWVLIEVVDRKKA